MNIFVVSQYYYPEPFRINEVCEEIVKRGHNVTVLTAIPNYPDGEYYDGYDGNEIEEYINGVKVIRCKCKPRHKGSVKLAINYIDFVVQANKCVNKMEANFDVIYIYQLSPVLSSIPAINFGKKHKIPIFLYCLDVWPESLRGSILGNPLGMKIFGYISKKIYNSANIIAVTSPIFKQYLSNFCDINPNSIYYIPQHSSCISYNDEKILKNNGIIDIYFIGNLGEAQNLNCLFKAVSIIKDRSKLKVHIVGSGSCFENYTKMSNELNLNDTVIFHGRYPKDKLSLFYSSADICYVSLKDNGIVGSTIPGKLQEYMSAGKPILACINGDTARVIEEAGCGVCVPANDVQNLASAIIDFMNMKYDLKQMGKNSKKYFDDNFTLSKHVDEIERVFGELI